MTVSSRNSSQRCAALAALGSEDAAAPLDSASMTADAAALADLCTAQAAAAAAAGRDAPAALVAEIHMDE